jgi:hypothetical protein
MNSHYIISTDPTKKLLKNSNYGIAQDLLPNIYVNLPVLDIYAGLDSNFFLLLTSNTQTYRNNLNYFSAADYNLLRAVDASNINFKQN